VTDIQVKVPPPDGYCFGLRLKSAILADAGTLPAGRWLKAKSDTTNSRQLMYRAENWR